MARDSIFENYEKLLAGSALFSGLPESSTKYNPNDEDSETFITEEELEMMNGSVDEEDRIIGKTIPSGPREIEESVYFKRFGVKKEHKYTEAELKAIRESCMGTIVHDYGENDEYHISDEEKARIDSLNEVRMKLNGVTKMYRKIDKYINAMRVVVEAWELLERKDNYLHTREEFFDLVAKGKIYNSSIIMPKMKGLDKYNLDMVIKYISNPELDPSVLVPVDPKKQAEDEWYKQFEEGADEDVETDEETRARLLSPEEIQFIEENASNPPPLKVHDIKRKYIKGYDQRSYSGKKKKLSKKDKRRIESLHPLLRKIQNNPNNRDEYSAANRSYLITSSMFEQPKPVHTFWDDIRYDGSWTDKNAMFFYDLAVEEAIMGQNAVGNRYETNRDVELANFFRIMESNGINVIEFRRRMNMSDDSVQARMIKKAKKDNKKRESALLQRITKLNNNPKFKNLISKAEKAANDGIKDY